MIRLELPAETAALRLVGPWLRALLTYTGEERADSIAERLDLALQEVCVNVVEHAYDGQEGGRIQLDYEYSEGHHFTVSDTGAPFNPTDRPKVDLDTPTEGGYGLHLIEELCDTFVYERRNGRNRWMLSVS